MDITLLKDSFRQSQHKVAAYNFMAISDFLSPLSKIGLNKELRFIQKVAIDNTLIMSP